MLDHPDPQGLRHVGLLARDAVTLYRGLGFTTLGELTCRERRGHITEAER